MFGKEKLTRGKEERSVSQNRTSFVSQLLTSKLAVDFSQPQRQKGLNVQAHMLILW